MNNLFRGMIEIYKKEDLIEYLNKLSEHELNTFLKILVSYNSEIENKLIKRKEMAFLKLNIFKLVLKRIWSDLDENDKKQLAKFFHDVEDFVINYKGN